MYFTVYHEKINIHKSLYSNPIVNESFKFHILRSQIRDVECFYKILQY